MHIVLGNLAKQVLQAFGAGGKVAGIELHARLDQAQLHPGLHLVCRQQAHQLDQHAQVTMGIQGLRVVLHQYGGGRRVAAHDRMVNRFVQMVMVAEPGPGPHMDGLLFSAAARIEVLEQGFAQQRVQAIPGFPPGTVHRDQEQVVALQPCQQRIGRADCFGVTTQGCAKRGTKAVADCHEQQQIKVGG
ncbi:hypothetical protein D3C78_1239290 [compost metagenome]